MKSLLYEFQTIGRGEQKNYIFQLVKGRKLTNIYHSHDFYELIWFLKGSGIQLINDREMSGTEGEVIMLRPVDKHCFINQSEDVEVFSLSVKKEEFERLANSYEPLLMNTINNSETPFCFASLPLFAEAFHIQIQKSISEYDCKFLLSYFLNACIRSLNDLKHISTLPQNLELAIEELKKKENLKAGIPAFVALSHYSHSHLARLVKKHFGMSLKQYINELRLQSAYQDIILTNESVEEISESLGFSSFSHFNKIFKARFSITPAALRKNSGAWTA